MPLNREDITQLSLALADKTDGLNDTSTQKVLVMLRAVQSVSQDEIDTALALKKILPEGITPEEVKLVTDIAMDFRPGLRQRRPGPVRTL